MDAAWLDKEEEPCSKAVQVLLNNRKPSTKATFFTKWKRFFSVWSLAWGTQSTLACIQDIWECLLHGVFWSLTHVTEHSLSISSAHPREVCFLELHGSELLKGINFISTHL